LIINFQGGFKKLKFGGHEKLTLFFGSSNSGKKYLQKYITNDDELKINLVRGGKYAFHENGNGAQGVLPDLSVDPFTGDMLVDCPDFSSSANDPVRDIATNFFTEKVFRAAKMVKIVIVESDDVLKIINSKNPFFKTISKVADMMPDIGLMKGSVGFVVTNMATSSNARNQKHTTNKVKQYLMKLRQILFLEQEEHRRNKKLEREIKVFSVLINSDKAILPRPIKKTLAKANDDFEYLRYVVFRSLKFTNVGDLRFNFHTSPNSNQYIRKNLISNNKLNSILVSYGKLAGQKFSYLKEKISHTDLNLEQKSKFLVKESQILHNKIVRPQDFVHTLGTLVDLISILKFQSPLSLELEKMDFYFSAVKKDPQQFYSSVHKQFVRNASNKIKNLVRSYDFLIDLKNFLNSYNTQVRIQKLKAFRREITHLNFVKFFNFVKSYGFKLSNTQFFTNQGLLFEKIALQDLNVLWSDAVIKAKITSKENDNSRFLNGSVILLSQDLQNSYFSNHKNLVIAATSKIFIDLNLHLRNTHLALIAPLVEVIGNRKISMRGENAEIHKFATASAGKVGANGLMAYSSGKLTVISSHLKNGRALTIESEGGKGGDGQNGGKGRDGRPVYESLGGDDIKHKYYSSRHLVSNNDCKHKYQAYRCYFYLEISGGDGGSNGMKGGDGRLGALAGQTKLIVKHNNEHRNKVSIVSRVGPNGRGGAGGSAGRTTCVRKKIKAGCKHWLFSRLLSSCNRYSEYCSSHSSNYRGPNGRLRAEVRDYNYKYSSIEPNQLIGKYLESASSNPKTHFLDNQADLHFTKYLLSDRNIVAGYTLSWYYKTALQMFSIQMSILKQKEMVSEFYDSFQLHKHTACKNSRRNCNSPYLITLELAILSQLDLLETSESKVQVVKIQSALERLETTSSKIMNNWREVYKYSELKKHTQGINSQIQEGEQQTKKLMKTNVESLRSTLTIQVASIISSVNNQKETIKKNTEQLKKDRAVLQGNFWKRILFGILNVVSSIVSILFPVIGAATAFVTGVAENLLIKDPTVSQQMQIPAAIHNAKNLIQQFKANKIQGEQSKREIYKNGIEQALQIEKKSGKKIYDNALRAKLKKQRKDLNDKNYKVTKNFKNEVKSSLADASSVIDRKTIDSPNKYKFKKGLVKLAQAAKILTIGAAQEIGKIKGDLSKVDQITQQIEKNSENLEKLEQFETEIYNTFEPALDQMTAGFQKFTTDSKGMSSFMLEFKKFDMKRMTRQCITFIQQFTEGFAKEQSEIIKIIGDLEALMVTVMTNYDKINDLNNKIKFSALMGNMQSRICTSFFSEMCFLRLQLESVVKTNILKQKYLHLEKAYRQVIFPFVNNKLEILSPSNYMNGNDGNSKSTSQNIKVKIEYMLGYLNDRNNLIQSNNDKDLHISEFNSIYKSSRPFYKWLQTHHQDQIQRLLNGEKVVFVADVRHELVKNAVKFTSVSINITSFNPPAAKRIQELLQYLSVELIHSGESHLRCKNNYYAISGEKMTHEHSFERTHQGHLVSKNVVQQKYQFGDVPYSPYTVWTFQLKAKNPEAEAKLYELGTKWASAANVELVGHGTYLEKGSTVCNDNLGEYFDILE